MNIKEIKQELRRSACEDEYPLFDMDGFALEEACVYKSAAHGEFIGGLLNDDQRTFFLLVAEAL